MQLNTLWRNPTKKQTQKKGKKNIGKNIECKLRKKYKLPAKLDTLWNERMGSYLQHRPSDKHAKGIEMGIRPLVCLFVSCTRCSATREREKERDCARWVVLKQKHILLV